MTTARGSSGNGGFSRNNPTNAAAAGAPASSQPAAAAAPSGNGTVGVSLLGIISLLPNELKPARAVGDLASVQLSFPERPLLEQLPQGCIRVTFGEVRKLAPEGVFPESGEHDQKLIELPLQEILPQLQAVSFGRRGNQKATHVPEEVTGLFSARTAAGTPSNRSGSGSSSTTTFTAPGNASGRGSASAPSPSPSARSSTPPTPPSPAGAAAGAASPAKSKIPGPALTPPAAKNAPAKPAVSAKISGPKDADVPSAGGPATASRTSAAKSPAGETTPPPVPASGAPSEAEGPAPVSKPIAAPSLLAAMRPTTPPAGSKEKEEAKSKASAPIPGPSLSMSSKSAAPAAPAAGTAPPKVSAAAAPGTRLVRPSGATPAAASANASGRVSVGLAGLSAQWPEEVRDEIANWNLQAATVGFPEEEVSSALRHGKVQYSWTQILGWIQGVDLSDKVSAVGDTVLELPLQVIAPVFMASRQASSSPAKSSATRASVDQNIPDLFQGGKPAESPAPAAAAAGRASAAPSAKAVFVEASTGGGSSDTTFAVQVLSVPLAMVDDSWLPAIKNEIARTQLTGLKLEVPATELSRSLKIGKIEYPWRQMRQWIKPALPENTGAEHADKLITLPLKVVAPLFLSQCKPGRAQKKQAVGTDIPDLFSGGNAVVDDASSGAASAAADASNGASKAASGPSPAVLGATSFSTTQFMRKPPNDLGELFGQPGKRNWTPNEIVQNTTRIRGVAGAVIAMQDGLLVAAQLPSPWKPEATAAFLPQIYSRLTQYLTELNAGELTSAVLTTASGTLMVYNAGIIYFAVVGKVDETVPASPIHLIVSELSRHTK